ncbi:phosphotransferase family protein [Actinoplanes couchii]|uniref:Protein kinase domain-containing protein n=1 Tax=Actinoplanes couchii TaxID=403638 RepID=A0ABQ3XPQ5_9ACTN|nr:phosphotransferase [Actinoplanes couchii]MDR6319114.1 aminoglycoside phosphotransferase (APT) family kinase protein [Actinoplanes couchii]GID60455.1 hypothetical protein Aco03nite_088590 [Actinoplanes couchii]
MTFTPRAAWADTPEAVRDAVAAALGSAIVEHTDLHGGMSPGPAVSLRLADGRRIFVKAVSAEVRAHNHRMIAQESEVLAVLPTSVRAPERLATVEHGPWIALATTWADGTTGATWTDASIEAVTEACRTANRHRIPAALSPAALPSAVLPLGALPPVVERVFDFDGWTRLLATGQADEWEIAHSKPAAAVVDGWEQWTAGEFLVHRDIRLDNTTVDAKTGSALLLDWAYASVGAPWIDLAQLAADIVGTGHVLGPQTATDRAYRLLRTLPPEASRFVVGLAGMWCIKAATIPDTVMPGIAAWRRARSVALRPLVTRLIADQGLSPTPKP